MLLMKSSTYRAADFMEAAGQLDIEVIRVVDTPEPLAQTGPDLLAIPFADSDAAVRAIVQFTEERPVVAILSVDDSGAMLAARASQALSLPHNDPQAAEAARDKHRMRTLMAQRGVPVPGFQRFTTADDPQEVAQQVSYPCVVKPLRLSGSRGVIRADDEAQLIHAVQRLAKILQETEAGDGPKPFLVEDYLPGDEAALEGLLDDGDLHVLALFDKPDPLEGPFFEETIYVTPSRLPPRVQAEIAEHTAHAARALGLQRGPVHAELRINERGPWLLEIAGRSIGGLCSRVLRFGVDTSLESLILRQAVGMSVAHAHREATPRGVMMIPIPRGGLLRGYDGVEDARAVAGVTGVEITAPLNHTLSPLPEGDSYLGFIFARGATPAAVEAALREAHAKVRFHIDPVIPLRVGGPPA
ncbi:MAG TPA: ATP-grasp domain-containing protein [Candidatus Sulfomarinibacteraceae bacterium]|nr:ATP-grasp domain-containing protein [Candidatus Sulfomarinibacteraceae bacterium]